MRTTLASIILDVSDLDRSLGFYAGALGLAIRRRERCEGHRLAYLESGGATLLLLQQPPSDQDPSLDRSGGLVVKFYVQGLRALALCLAEAGAPILRRLECPPRGERTLLVADPDGYAVLLAEPVEELN